VADTEVQIAGTQTGAADYLIGVGGRHVLAIGDRAP
jgi:hypothetical protein